MKNKSDLQLAEQICNELRNDNLQGIIELNERYGTFFKKFIEIKLNKVLSGKIYTSLSIVDDILQNFWLKKIVNKTVVCDYKAKNDASLKTFLLSILYFHIIDEVKTIKKKKEIPLESIDLKNIKTVSPIEKNEKEREQLIIEELINTSFERLSSIRPKDAKIISLRMEGFSYEKIAINLGEDPNSHDFKRKVDGIKKQCTRTGSGSFSRFKIIFNRLLKEKNITLSFEEGLSITPIPGNTET